ncbi:uncharacterized protein PGTG_18375 [Puccinia graminis f. sp. tritici CRL 75-36-700-3]|uniref:Uncharacterized protein n=1 Tax=Puccinia graminis f. sp. tritici (strain CRL 75-36-700-3 / race SCCL) TaxID=418459 RepID=E3L765_PUCGT|nr:uncharacterized protein PGTG_18375 [Puccinia graminis f. sp. tritici CRL 75-36-700-3]EFP92388.1 hypothetical protein PGTG_18375 [Puccinia graminis f. sp. tritici CRL 75-36-700-3]
MRRGDILASFLGLLLCPSSRNLLRFSIAVPLEDHTRALTNVHSIVKRATPSQPSAPTDSVPDVLEKPAPEEDLVPDVPTDLFPQDIASLQFAWNHLLEDDHHGVGLALPETEIDNKIGQLNADLVQALKGDDKPMSPEAITDELEHAPKETTRPKMSRQLPSAESFESGIEFNRLAQRRKMIPESSNSQADRHLSSTKISQVGPNTKILEPSTGSEKNLILDRPTPSWNPEPSESSGVTRGLKFPHFP